MEVKTSNGIIFGLFVAPEVNPEKAIQIKLEKVESEKVSTPQVEKKTSPKKGK